MRPENFGAAWFSLWWSVVMIVLLVGLNAFVWTDPLGIIELSDFPVSILVFARVLSGVIAIGAAPLVLGEFGKAAKFFLAQRP